VHSTDVDETDDLPVWSCAPAEALAPGLSAVGRLGVGTRCESWLAWSLDLWHPVVVKLARPHQRTHPRAVRSLRREADALARLGHPGAPRLLREATDAEVPHVVLEYVDGPSLADLVDESGPLGPTDVAVLGTQLLSVLRTLHSRGLAHVDVKPENVLVRDGRPFLVDFGSARTLGSPQPAGSPVGTPGYAAPEMEACEPIGAGMDVFGVGTVLAEALTGTPYPDGDPLPASPLTPLVERLLADDVAARPSVADALLDLAEHTGAERPWPAWADKQLAVTAARTPPRSAPAR
jgi:serine/threonine protein kinase